MVIGKKNIKELVGVVASAKMQQTLVVEVPRVREDRIYRKRYTIKKKYYVHDSASVGQEGDTVRIRETRPISKLKRWELIEVVQKAVV